MRLIVFLCALVFVAFDSYAEKLKCTPFFYEGWKGTIWIDDFENEANLLLRKDIHKDDMSKAGFIVLDSKYLLGKERLTIVSLNINGLTAAWPKCDYEFAKYKVDDHDSSFFDKYGAACPMLLVDDKMLEQMSTGKNLRMSAKNKTVNLDLTGFNHIFTEAMIHVKDNKCLGQ